MKKSVAFAATPVASFSYLKLLAIHTIKVHRKTSQQNEDANAAQKIRRHPRELTNPRCCASGREFFRAMRIHVF
jgi:hypothetical protein